MSDKSPVILCTGFHRSATSLCSHILSDAGVDMGRNLIGAHISNPDGHYEDAGIVKNHDSILGSLGTSWKYTGEVALEVSAQHQEWFSKYVAQHDNDGHLWGFKDPRSALFLKQWAKALGDRGSYVITFRHWSSCSQSLYNRDSRQLSHHTPPVKPCGKNIEFFSDPRLAAAMWLEYNKRILHFIENNPGNCLLVSANDLINGLPLIEMVNDKFQLQLSPPEQSLIKNQLFTEEVDQLVIEHIPHAMHEELDKVWKRLCELSGTPNSEPPKVVDKLRVETASITATLLQRCTHNNQITPNSNTLDHGQSNTAVEQLDDNNTFESLAGRINAELDKFRKDLSLLTPLIAKAQELAPNCSDIYLWKGRVAMEEQRHTEAELNFHRAIYLGNHFPYMYLYLGNACEGRGETAIAEMYYKTAYERNSQNINFANALARLNLSQGKYAETLTWLEKARELNPHNNITLITLSELYEKQGDMENAIACLSECQMPSCNIRRITLLLATNTVFGSEEYKRLIRQKLALNKPGEWLCSAISALPTPESTRFFSHWVVHHWLSIFSKEELESDNL